VAQLFSLGGIERTVKLSRIIIISSVVIAIALYGLHIYYSEFYYDPGLFSIGVRNDIPDMTLRDVTLRAEPHGVDLVGILSSGQADFYMDPLWPVPTNLSVSFSDPDGSAHTLSTTGAPPDFRGRICVVITKTTDYALHLELERRK
jgi:hypothetical protein